MPNVPNRHNIIFVRNIQHDWIEWNCLFNECRTSTIIHWLDLIQKNQEAKKKKHQNFCHFKRLIQSINDHIIMINPSKSMLIDPFFSDLITIKWLL